MSRGKFLPLVLLLLSFFAQTAFAQGIRAPSAPSSGGLSLPGQGAAAPVEKPGVSAPARPKEGDRIVAIVNNEVITSYELRARLDATLSQLKRQGTPPPSEGALEKQVLERLIIGRLQLQRARARGIRADDSQLDQALNRIASSNNMSLGQFRRALEKDGVSFASFREDLRSEMTTNFLREREVQGRIVVSEGEIDNYIAHESNAASTEDYLVAHILLRAPEGASPEALRKLRQKGEEILKRLEGGQDFAQAAAANSDAPDALSGGSLGWRTLERMPSLFAEAVVKMKPGSISPLLSSSNGFHILKLLEKRGATLDMPPVEQIHARHILIKVNELVSEPEARHKLEGLRDRLQHGGDFAELARLYSQDATAARGGDLGWIYPGDTVPEFEQVLKLLKPGELSQPVQTQFGLHLIEVLERRTQEASQDRRRQVVRQILNERKSDEAYQDWLRQLRDEAYVEYRLEEQ
ncbi:MAG: peptidylprolyl isomerase [Betaproteobacteria bacterium]|nr:peptidylprolyl isomerase [Betaproteobacteria bacterium]